MSDSTHSVPDRIERTRSPGADAGRGQPDHARGDGAGTRSAAAHRGRAAVASRRRMIWIGAAALLVILVMLMLRPTPLVVETGRVVRGPLETIVEAEGVTRVRDRFQVAAPITGRVARIALRDGDMVQAGTVLARITSVPLDPGSLAQARARVTAAEAAVQEAQTRLQQAGEMVEQTARTAARLREMASAGAVSREDVEQAELQLASAQREQEATRSRQRAANAELAAARAALLDADPGRRPGSAEAVVRSPSAGRVLRIPERSERVVTAGTPLMEIGDAMGLEVVVDVLSTDAVRVETGAPLRVVRWGRDSVLMGQVRLVEPSGFTKISTLGVEEQRVNVIGDLPAMPAGLGDAYRIEAEIITWQADDVVKVPNSALFRTGGDWTVFVVDGGRARRRTVSVGQRGARESQVLSGLAVNEEVVLFPSDQIEDGDRVRPAA